MRGHVIAAVMIVGMAACARTPTDAWRDPPPNRHALADPDYPKPDGVIFSSPEEMGARLRHARAERVLYHRLSADNEAELAAAVLIGAPELRDRILARAQARCRGASADDLSMANSMVVGAIAMRRTYLDSAVSSYLHHFAALPMIDERADAEFAEMARVFEAGLARAEFDLAALRLRIADPGADLGAFAAVAARYETLAAQLAQARQRVLEIQSRDVRDARLVQPLRCEAGALEAALEGERRALIAEHEDRAAILREAIAAAEAARARLTPGARPF